MSLEVSNGILLSRIRVLEQESASLIPNNGLCVNTRFSCVRGFVLQSINTKPEWFMHLFYSMLPKHDVPVKCWRTSRGLRVGFLFVLLMQQTIENVYIAMTNRKYTIHELFFVLVAIEIDQTSDERSLSLWSLGWMVHYCKLRGTFVGQKNIMAFSGSVVMCREI